LYLRDDLADILLGKQAQSARI